MHLFAILAHLVSHAQSIVIDRRRQLERSPCSAPDSNRKKSRLAIAEKCTLLVVRWNITAWLENTNTWSHERWANWQYCDLAVWQCQTRSAATAVNCDQRNRAAFYHNKCKTLTKTHASFATIFISPHQNPIQGSHDNCRDANQKGPIGKID